MLVKVFYTNWFIPAKFAAMTYGPFIFIRPSREGDVGLLEHEKVHVRQFWSNPIMFPLRYLVSKEARFGYEVEAYREQLKYRPDRLDAFAIALSTKYGLNVSMYEARLALTKE